MQLQVTGSGFAKGQTVLRQLPVSSEGLSLGSNNQPSPSLQTPGLHSLTWEAVCLVPRHLVQGGVCHLLGEGSEGHVSRVGPLLKQSQLLSSSCIPEATSVSRVHPGQLQATRLCSEPSPPSRAETGHPCGHATSLSRPGTLILRRTPVIHRGGRVGWEGVLLISL